jgi:integrase
MPLSNIAIKKAKPRGKPYKLSDFGGLYLLIKPNGSKLWRWKYRIDGKENVYSIGDYPTVSLVDARVERDAARLLVKQGIHPAHNRQSRKAAQVEDNTNSFAAVSKGWINQRKPKWTPRYLQQIENALAADVYPYIGDLPMRSVTAAHLLAIIKRVEKRGSITAAILIRQWCSAIFRYAAAHLLADADPASMLKGAIDKPKVEHSQPLAKKDIPKFINALESYGGYRSTVIALKLLMLTFVRTVELRGAEWKEFDLDAAEWRIPAERMKMREPHIVPLSQQAIELLLELQTYTGSSGFLFQNCRRPKTCMTSTTLNRAIERMGYSGRFSAHGFRATASTMLNEMRYPTDYIERQLAHAESDKTRASYNRAEYLPERKEMMQTWANMIDEMAKPVSNISPIKHGKVVA